MEYVLLFQSRFIIDATLARFFYAIYNDFC